MGMSLWEIEHERANDLKKLQEKCRKLEEANKLLTTKLHQLRDLIIALYAEI